MKKELLLCAAMIGSKYVKKPSQFAPEGVPKISYTVEETLAEFVECYKAGVRFVHVHSRGSDGEHIANPMWYQSFAQQMRSQYPDVKICFATSRSGEVMHQIEAKYQSLIPQLPEIEARIESEMVRAACLDANEAHLLPHFLTAFTSTEVRMDDENADIGHVGGAQDSNVIKAFVNKITNLANKKNVCHEIEITTLNSINIIENLQKAAVFSTPISIVILPGFTKNFQFVPEVLDEVIYKAHLIIKANAGRGFITLGRILNPDLADIEDKRVEFIQYAINNPFIHAIRVGIEDGPYWNNKPSSNFEIVEKSAKLIQAFGGNVITSAEQVNAITGL